MLYLYSLLQITRGRVDPEYVKLTFWTSYIPKFESNP